MELRDNTKLSVTLDVEDGKVKGSAAASEDGGILSLVRRVIQNKNNSAPSGPPPSLATTELRSRSGVNSSVSSAPTTSADVPADILSSGPLDAFRVMAEPEADQNSPCNGGAVPQSPAEEKLSNTSGKSAVNDAPAHGCAAPAE